MCNIIYIYIYTCNEAYIHNVYFFMFWYERNYVYVKCHEHKYIYIYYLYIYYIYISCLHKRFFICDVRVVHRHRSNIDGIKSWCFCHSVPVPFHAPWCLQFGTAASKWMAVWLHSKREELDPESVGSQLLDT